MPHRILAWLHSQQWAIAPGYLPAMEALAVRFMGSPDLLALSEDGHAERRRDWLGAVASMGAELEGTRSGTIRNGVACLPIMGPIMPRASLMSLSGGALSLDSFARDFRASEANPDVSTILGVFDSPGGSVVGLNEAAQLIAASTKPTVAYVSGQCASAAYWLASAFSEIVADPTALLGSIGVLFNGSQQVQPDASGRMTFEIASTGAPKKRPDLTTEEGRSVMRAAADDLHAHFIAAIAAGRKLTPEAVQANFGEGGPVKTSDALRVGMVDRLDSLEATLIRLSRRPVPTGGASSTLGRNLDARRRRAGSN